MEPVQVPLSALVALSVAAGVFLFAAVLAGLYAALLHYLWDCCDRTRERLAEEAAKAKAAEEARLVLAERGEAPVR